MSACSFEFRQPPSGTREPRADRANRNSQRERRLLVAQTGPGAQREDFLFAPRQLFDEPEHPKHFALGVEPLLNILGKSRVARGCGSRASADAYRRCERRRFRTTFVAMP
jgi:hypothetical protein